MLPVVFREEAVKIKIQHGAMNVKRNRGSILAALETFFNDGGMVSDMNDIQKRTADRLGTPVTGCRAIRNV